MKEILTEALNLAFRRAKIAQFGFVGFQVLIFVLGLLGAFLPNLAAFLVQPLILFLILVAAVVLVYISDSYKDKAEGLLRHHENWDAYGQTPPPELIPRLALDAQGKLSEKEKQLLNQGLTFASEEKIGDRRCLENLRQSAWFTSHLTGTCAYALGALVILINLGAIALLTYTLQAPLQPAVESIAAQSVCAAILFIQGVGLIPTAILFIKVSNESWQTVREVTAELKKTEFDPLKVRWLLTEYQVRRSAAPLIPDVAWKVRRTRLNSAFALFKEQGT
jgi:hypothetical protein